MVAMVMSEQKQKELHNFIAQTKRLMHKTLFRLRVFLALLLITITFVTKIKKKVCVWYAYDSSYTYQA